MDAVVRSAEIQRAQVRVEARFDAFRGERHRRAPAAGGGERNKQAAAARRRRCTVRTEHDEGLVRRHRRVVVARHAVAERQRLGRLESAAGAAADRVMVRDSQDQAGPVLSFSPEAWRVFIATEINGR